MNQCQRIGIKSSTALSGETQWNMLPRQTHHYEKSVTAYYVADSNFYKTFGVIFYERDLTNKGKLIKWMTK